MLCFACTAYAEVRDEAALGIGDVTRLALENNFDIQIYRLDQRISEKELLKAQAVYDTNFDADYEYNKDKLDSPSLFAASTTTSVEQQAGLDKTLPTGTILSLDVGHLRQSSNSMYNTINPYHESAFEISVTQPLARNFLGVIDRNTVKVTGLDVENTGYTSLDKIESELGGSQKAYWNLVLAYKALELTDNMLANTRELFKANKRKYDIGLVEAPEFYAVEADVNQKENDVLLANDNLNQALNLLRLKLNLNKDTVISPADDFDQEEITASFEDVIKTALRNRRDYKSAKNTVKAKDLSIEMKKSAMWPQIDLKGTFAKNGLDGKFKNSIREITSRDNPEYSVEVVFSIPLENSKARAEYSQKELERARALVALKKVECLIFVQTNDAYVHAKRSYDSVKLLRRAADFEYKKYTGEEDRFNKGRSDTDRLLRYQNDFFTAELQYLRSLYTYKAAVIDLNITMNNLLRTDEESL